LGFNNLVSFKPNSELKGEKWTFFRLVGTFYVEEVLLLHHDHSFHK